MVMRIARMVAFGLLAALPAAAETLEEARQRYLDGDYLAGVEGVRPYAEAGDPVAQNLVGHAYYYGNGYEADCDAALHWVTLAAEQGLDRAMLNLGRHRDVGCFGANRDNAEAERWYRRAAEAGFAPVLPYLANLLAEGRGAAPADPAEIRALLDQARAAEVAATGPIEARLLILGLGLPQDLQRAMDLIRPALDAGEAEGVRLLGTLRLADGDPAAAYALFSDAMAMGSGTVAVDLAELQTEGSGYWHDPVQGWALCLWAMSTAGVEGRSEAAARCQAIRPRVSLADAMTATLRAESWR